MLRITALLGLIGCLMQGVTLAAEGEVADLQFYANSASNSFSNNVRHVLQKRLTSLKIDLEVLDANRNQEEQNKQFRQRARANVPAVVDLVDASQCQELLTVARQLKVTTIFINEPPAVDQIKGQDQFWYIGNDNQVVAQQQARLVADYLKNAPQADLNGNGTVEIMLVQGKKKNSVCIERASQLKAALDASGIKYKIVYDFDGEWSYEHTFNQVHKLLTDPRAQNVDLVVAHNDDMALGAVGAMQDLGELDDSMVLPPAFGIGGTSEAINAIAEGDLMGTVRLDYMRIADVATAISIGKKDPKILGSIAGQECPDNLINIPCNTILSSREKTGSGDSE